MSQATYSIKIITVQVLHTSVLLKTIGKMTHINTSSINLNPHAFCFYTREWDSDGVVCNNDPSNVLDYFNSLIHAWEAEKGASSFFLVTQYNERVNHKNIWNLDMT